MWSSLSFDAQLLLLRGAVLLVLYLFIGLVVLAVMGDLRRAARRPQRQVQPESTYGRLVLIEPGPTGLDPEKEFPLEAVSSIGRSLRSTVSLDDEFLSADHALLSWREGKWWLEDLGSTNGTLLNGVRITRPMPVTAGDLIELGRVALRLKH